MKWRGLLAKAALTFNRVTHTSQRIAGYLCAAFSLILVLGGSFCVIGAGDDYIAALCEEGTFKAEKDDVRMM